MRTSLLLYLLLSVSITVKAQTDSIENPFGGFGEAGSAYHPITISYWGESFFHPGLKIQYYGAISSKEKLKKKKKRTKHRVHHFYYGPHLGYFIHPGNHQGVAIGTDVGYRIIKAKTKEQKWKGRGFVFDVFVNVDYLLQLNNGSTYAINEAGEVRKVPSARSYLMPGAGIGLGYAAPNFSALLRPNVSFQMPYSANVLPRGFVELAFFVPILKIN